MRNPGMERIKNLWTQGLFCLMFKTAPKFMYYLKKSPVTSPATPLILITPKNPK